MMLGNNDNYSLEHLTRELLEMKENFAKQLLELADKIEPGCTKIRGQILLELQMAQVKLDITVSTQLISLLALFRFLSVFTPTVQLLNVILNLTLDGAISCSHIATELNHFYLIHQ